MRKEEILRKKGTENRDDILESGQGSKDSEKERTKRTGDSTLPPQTYNIKILRY